MQLEEESILHLSVKFMQAPRQEIQSEGARVDNIIRLKNKHLKNAVKCFTILCGYNFMGQSLYSRYIGRPVRGYWGP